MVAWHGRRHFFQPVPLGYSLVKAQSSNLMAIRIGDRSRQDLSVQDELLVRSQQTSVELDGTALVFVGYGIVAPQFNWNDYSGLDVSGKVVVILPNDPGGERFLGERMTYYGRWEYKYEEAARQGAVGAVIVHTDELFGSPFTLVINEMRRALRFLPGTPRSRLQFEGICSERFGREVLSSSGVDLDAFLVAPRPMGRHADRLRASLHMHLSFEVTVRRCRNVLAMRKGKLFPRQCILLCAHWDHLGQTSDPAQPRGYYPGAVDNAVGVSVLLDLAKRLTQASPLCRTVLFAWTSAEEVGMLGSARAAQWIRDTGLDVVAAFNVDGFVPIGKTRDLNVVDGDQSDLPTTLMHAATAFERFITLDDDPRAGYFYRSDQASFAKIGIPSLQVSTGADLMKGGVQEGAKRHDFYDTHNYHRTSDTFNRYWDFTSICADIDVIHEALLLLGNSSRRPKLRSHGEGHGQATQDAR
ncbi:M28 family peptidase [Pseudomonas sp. S75]|uniref:M28 family peptidase n=1 Tax=unclassified Pseudomonas TaxID=196821 RepID=UPI001902D280|nr:MULTISPECIES: M28 family peptidase [unclassified Pseudomonas]MBK0155939.1 M28 family peptidase [Pseudomonas sp. S75]